MSPLAALRDFILIQLRTHTTVTKIKNKPGTPSYINSSRWLFSAKEEECAAEAWKATGGMKIGRQSHTVMLLHFAFCVGVCDFLRLEEMVKYWLSAGREQTYGWFILWNSWCFIVFKEEIDVKEKVAPSSAFTKLIVSKYVLKISW